MASPPPGGSGSPPPYPQQYPPQQPYYPQAAAPPPKKSNALLIAVIVVVIIVVVVAVAWYAISLMFQPVTSSTVRVTGVSWTVVYGGGGTYFGASPLTTCNGCPITITFPNYQFTYNLVLTNSDSVAHNVTDISVSGIYFNLHSSSPDPSTISPVVVNAGSSRTFVLTITATPLTGDHTLTGTIDTD